MTAPNRDTRPRPAPITRNDDVRALAESVATTMWDASPRLRESTGAARMLIELDAALRAELPGWLAERAAGGLDAPIQPEPAYTPTLADIEAAIERRGAAGGLWAAVGAAERAYLGGKGLGRERRRAAMSAALAPFFAVRPAGLDAAVDAVHALDQVAHHTHFLTREEIREVLAPHWPNRDQHRPSP